MAKKFLNDLELVASAEGKSGLKLTKIAGGQVQSQGVTILAHDDTTGEVVRFDNSTLAQAGNAINEDKAREVAQEIVDAAVGQVTPKIDELKATEAGKYTDATTGGHTIGSIKDIAGNTHDIKETVTSIPEFSFTGTTLKLSYKNEEGQTESKTVDLSGLVTVDVNLDSATFESATKVLTLRETDGDTKQVNLGSFDIVTEDGGDGTKVIKQHNQTLFTLPNFDKIVANREVHTVALEANVDKEVAITMTAAKYILQVFDEQGEEVEMKVKQAGKTVTLNSTLAGNYTLVVI